jgi:hypothetical protein
MKSLEDHLLALIETGAIKGSLSHREGGILSFNQESAVSTKNKTLYEHLQDLQKRGRWLEEMNRKLSLSDAFLSRGSGTSEGFGLGKKRGSYAGQGDLLLHDEAEEAEDLMLIHSS